MSEPSEDEDRAWDEDPKEEIAATSGEAEVHQVPTPPPASGDAYSADTVIRDVPPAALAAIREKRKNSEKRRAAEAKVAPEKKPETPSEKPVEAKSEKPAEVKTEKPAEAKTEKPVEAKAEEKKPVEEPKKAAPPKAPAKAETKSAPHAPAPTIAIAPPVTSGELTIAFAAAIALIVIGFYAIAGAF